jgi:hypothetical protein
MSQSTFKIDQFLQLLDLAYQTIQSLAGKSSTDPRLPDCQQLADKLFFHAATIYWLRQGTKAPGPHFPNGEVWFYDFASTAVLTRAALETYLTLFEVFFEPATDDEFEFSHALWQLSGFVIRENFAISDPAFRQQVADSQKQIQEMRTRLQRTKKFNALKPGEQKNVLEGKRKRDWTNLARAAGFGEQTIRQMYAYYSGYVHADGLSGVQIVGAQSAKDQTAYIEIHMTTLMIVLSKLVIQYAAKFPEAKAVCDNNPSVFYRVQVLSGAANLVP